MKKAVRIFISMGIPLIYLMVMISAFFTKDMRFTEPDDPGNICGEPISEIGPYVNNLISLIMWQSIGSIPTFLLAARYFLADQKNRDIRECARVHRHIRAWEHLIWVPLSIFVIICFFFALYLGEETDPDDGRSRYNVCSPYGSGIFTMLAAAFYNGMFLLHYSIVFIAHGVMYLHVRFCDGRVRE